MDTIREAYGIHDNVLIPALEGDKRVDWVVDGCTPNVHAPTKKTL